jgi:copper(I)-binding protein
MSVDNGIMRMRPAEPLAIPAGQTVKLAPGGVHVMLSGLKRTLSPGDSVAFEFDIIDSSGTKSLARASLPVRKLAP